MFEKRAFPTFFFSLDRNHLVNMTLNQSISKDNSFTVVLIYSSPVRRFRLDSL